jgi:hypothetical protein
MTYNERGIALPVALFALIVIGVLVAGNFFAGRLEQRVGQYSVFGEQALEAAEAGVADAMVNADAAGLAALAVGGAPTALEPITLTGGISVSRQITRLTTALFLIRVTGIRQDAAGGALAVRSLGLIARLNPAAAGSEPASPAGPLTPLSERAWIPWY